MGAELIAFSRFRDCRMLQLEQIAQAAVERSGHCAMVACRSRSDAPRSSRFADLTGHRARESERLRILAPALALLGCAGVSPTESPSTAEAGNEVEVFAGRLRDGGSVYQPGRTSEGEALCAEWEIDPNRRHLQFTYEREHDWTTTGFFFQFARSQLTLMGPHVRGRASSASFGGGVHARVRRAGPGELSVGGLRWFLAEADCIEVLDDPPRLLIPVFDPLPDDEASGAEEGAEASPTSPREVPARRPRE